MPRPTAEQMKDHVFAIAQKHGGKVLDYKNSTNNVVFRCSKGHEFSMWPNTVRYGHWCPFCAIEQGAKGKPKKAGVPPPYTPVWRRFGVLAKHTLTPNSIMIWNEEGKRLRMSIKNMTKNEEKDVLLKCDLLEGRHVVVKGWERGEGVRRNSDWFRDITLDDKTKIDLPIRGKKYVDTIKELKDKIDWQDRPRLEDMLKDAQNERFSQSMVELNEQMTRVGQLLEQSVDQPIQRLSALQEFEEVAERMSDLNRVREEATADVRLELQRVSDQFDDLTNTRNNLAHRVDRMIKGAKELGFVPPANPLEGGLGSLAKARSVQGLLGENPGAKIGVTDPNWKASGIELAHPGSGAVGQQIQAAISSARQMAQQEEVARMKAQTEAVNEAQGRKVAEQQNRLLEEQIEVMKGQLAEMRQPQGPTELQLANAELAAAKAERDAMRLERDLLQEREKSRQLIERLQVSLNMSTANNETLRQQFEAEQIADDPQQKEYNKDKQYFAQHHSDFVGKSFAIRVRTNKNNHAKNELALRAGIDMGERTQIEALFMKYETGNVFTVVFPEFKSTTRVALHHNGTDVYLKTVFNDTPGWVKAENKIGGANCKRRTDMTREAFIALYQDIMSSLSG